MYLFTLYKLWRNTLGNSLMNIQLKKSDIEILNKNKDSCENMQFVLGREMKWNPKWIFCLRDKLSVSTPSTALNRYRLLLRRYFGFTSTKSNPFAKNEISLQTLDIKSRKSRLPCQLSASTGIGESSPRYHLSSLISHLSPLPVTKLLWYQKRAEWAVSLNASMFNVTISSHSHSHSFFKMQFHM